MRRFWSAAYPGMRAHGANSRAIEAAGFALPGSFRLPNADWEEGYYGELERRLPALRAAHAEPEARAVLDAAAEEIAVFLARAGSFDYVFYVMRAPDRGAEPRPR